MPVYLFYAAAIIIACLVFNRISNRLGIPMLLAFILLGMIFGSDGLFQIPFDNYLFAEQICSTALLFIMFYGGFGTKWSEARSVATASVLLSTLGVVMTAGITGMFCYAVLHIGFTESFLIGSVISSTDAASVFSILRSKRLNLKYKTASMLEVESGSNDPFSYMLTAIGLAVMGGSATGVKIAYLVFAQLIYGVGFGLLIAFVALQALKRVQFCSAGFDTIFVFAVALFSYAAPAAVGGNGYLSAYLVGVILGNSPLKNKQTLVHFFDGLNGLMQMLIFFLLGLLAFPSKLPAVMLPAFLTALFLTLVARPAAVFCILTPFRCPLRQQLVVSWTGLRGAASIVFAIMVMMGLHERNYDVFHIVFCIVLFSILIQGSLLPFVSQKLDMIDQSDNVLRTFNDYTEEVPVQFMCFLLGGEHPWVGKTIREIVLPPGTLLVLLEREKKKIAPNGGTVLAAGDELVLSAKATEQMDGIHLSEVLLTRDSEWVGKHVSDIDLEPDKLIILIKRNHHIVIPNGKTSLRENDLLVINRSQ